MFSIVATMLLLIFESCFTVIGHSSSCPSVIFERIIELTFSSIPCCVMCLSDLDAASHESGNHDDCVFHCLRQSALVAVRAFLDSRVAQSLQGVFDSVCLRHFLRLVVEVRHYRLAVVLVNRVYNLLGKLCDFRDFRALANVVFDD